LEVLADNVPRTAKKAIICRADGYGRARVKKAAPDQQKLRCPSSLPDLIRQPMLMLGFARASRGFGEPQLGMDARVKPAHDAPGWATGR
jgi:hypothetical protein